MSRTRTLAPHLALLLVQVLFATFPVVGKVALRDFDPMALAVWRVGGGALCLGFLAWRLHPRAFLLPAGDLARAFGLSLLAVTLNQVLFIQGLARSGAVDAGLLMATIPVATYVFAVLLRRELLVGGRALGVLVAGAGTLMLVSRAGLPAGRSLGNLLMVANGSAYALYLVLARPLLLSRPPLVVTAWLFIFAVPAVAVLGAGASWWPSEAPPGARLAVLWVVVGPTILAYSLNSWALSQVSSSTTAAYIYLQPVLAAVGGILFLGETVGTSEALAGLAIFLGLYLVGAAQRARRRSARSAQAGVEAQEVGMRDT